MNQPWTISLTDTKENVLAAIAAAKDIPAEEKAALTRAVNALDGARIIRLAAQAVTDAKRANLHASVVAL